MIPPLFVQYKALYELQQIHLLPDLSKEHLIKQENYYLIQLYGSVVLCTERKNFNRIQRFKSSQGKQMSVRTKFPILFQDIKMIGHTFPDQLVIQIVVPI